MPVHSWPGFPRSVGATLQAAPSLPARPFASHKRLTGPFVRGLSPLPGDGASAPQGELKTRGGLKISAALAPKRNTGSDKDHSAASAAASGATGAGKAAAHPRQQAAQLC
jgi:hypothetical protein